MKPQRSAGALRPSFPIRDRYTVSGLLVGDICFTCECRIVELAGEEGMVLAWCEMRVPRRRRGDGSLGLYFPRALIARRYGSAGVSGAVRIQ